MDSLTNLLLLLVIYFVFTDGVIASSEVPTGWTFGRVTFYGDMKGDETVAGACGYKNVFTRGYGMKTAALSEALFNNGSACGSCYEIKCIDDKRKCIPGTISITATNLCPPNYTKTEDIWCNPPQKHFDLARPMYQRIAQYKAGVVAVAFRRIKCTKVGGIKFEITGHPYWTVALVYNVGGAGDVSSVRIKGSSTNWIPMMRNWGQNWQTSERLEGQSLSFEVRTSDGQILQSYDVAPKNWQYGRTYVSTKNFH
jgi:hypothetical protein